VGVDRSAELEELSEDAAFCARHPKVETYLRCGRCDTPICPRCLVQTPVGARCRTCANVSTLPTFDVSPVYFARAQAAALVSGIVVGAIWAYLLPAFFGFFMILIIGFGVGWAVSESVSLATNRKRGLGLQISAVMGVGLAFLVKEFLGPGNFITDLDLIAAGVAAFFAASRLRIGG
jgi:hypothetical protein